MSSINHEFPRHNFDYSNNPPKRTERTQKGERASWQGPIKFNKLLKGKYMEVPDLQTSSHSKLHASKNITAKNIEKKNRLDSIVKKSLRILKNDPNEI